MFISSVRAEMSPRSSVDSAPVRLSRLIVQNARADELQKALAELRTAGRAAFLVADCGGGVVQVSAYELNASAPPARIRELHRELGAAFGANCAL